MFAVVFCKERSVSFGGKEYNSVGYEKLILPFG